MHYANGSACAILAFRCRLFSPIFSGCRDFSCCMLQMVVSMNIVAVFFRIQKRYLMCLEGYWAMCGHRMGEPKTAITIKTDGTQFSNDNRII